MGAKLNSMGLTIQLPPETEAVLKARAEAAGVGAERYALQLLERELSVSEPPVSEMIREIVGDIPAEELVKIPKDGSSQVDHYVYGLPKKSR